MRWPASSAQLLQRFDLLQPAGAHPRELAQESGAVGIQANVAQPVAAAGHALAVLGEGVARPRDRRTAEVQRIAIGRAHQLDRVGIEQQLDLLDRRGQGGHVGAALAQGRGRGLDAGDRREGLVALQVDHHGVVAPAGDLGAVIATCTPLPSRARAMRSSSVATHTSEAPASKARRATRSTSGSPPKSRSGLPGRREAA
jgi:hypothetical protein